MNVYIVTSGCYSDYGIDAVLETREQAEAYCALHQREDQDIEEWNTDDYSVKTDKPVLKKWLGYLNRDGTIKVIFEGYSFDRYFKMETVSYYWSNACKRIRFTTAKGKTEEQAKKILQDKLATLKYERETWMEFE